MTTLSSDFNLDDLSAVQLPSGELERYIHANFGLPEEQPVQATQEMNGQVSSQVQTGVQGGMIRQVQSPMFSSAALTSEPAPQQAPARSSNQPYMEIVEQPQSRGLRFRYECEGRSAGSIPGEHSSSERKTFPTIKIRNYKGPAIVVVSCVTRDALPHCKPHPHSLVGKDCKKGVCTVKVKDTDTITFPHLGIQCAKKKDVENSLKQRKEINVDPFQTGFNHGIGQIDLNVVRLCFQVFLPDASGKITRVVPPVVSQLIHDKKSVNELTICRVDRSSGKAKGGDEIFLLCEKVNKDDIQVRFYKDTAAGCMWEEFGDFGQGDVHRQFAVVFKTPPYKEAFIQQPVDVLMQLKRPSDNETSESIPFTYMPEDPDPDRIEEKRKRKAAHFVQNWGGSVSERGNATVKEGLRTKLRANRRIKQEGEPMMQDELPRYSFTNTGASATAGSMTGMPTMNIRTADNTAMGSMTVSNTASTAANPQFQHLRIDHTGNVIDSSVVQNQQQQQNIIIEGGQININPETIDMELLHAYLQDAQGGSNDALSADLLDETYDPNVAAMESVSSNVQAMTHPGSFAATQESLQGLSENS
ncbi:putative transcription factor p65 homolog [Haliotis rubra]|uniref:putative transcription factor p65 homolog n=1 Tax=Haliotis rubra TaxID=36100 RepID=UPI001EE5F0F7|nr:putative transcription factor p65 homolog [Haliotis rubra]